MPPRDETLGCTRPNRPLDLPFDQRLATKAQEDANVSTIRRLTNPTSEPNSSDREEGKADGSAPVRRSRGKRRRRWWSGIGRGRERDGTTHSCSLEELVVLGVGPALARLGDGIRLAHTALLRPPPLLLSAPGDGRDRRIQRVRRRAHRHHHLPLCCSLLLLPHRP